MEINQSLVKRIAKKYCPKKLKAELDGVWKRSTTEAMTKGQYFEWLLFKTKNREGQIPEMKLLKNGKKSTDQIRIEKQAEIFFDVCKQHQIKFYGTDRTFHTELFGYKTFGTWDGYGLHKRNPVILDVKLPGNIDNDFGDFCWGDFESMDKIQAYTYMEAGLKMDGLKYDFVFMVFDYKKNFSHKILHVPYNPHAKLEVQVRLDETHAKLSYHEANGWDPIGIVDECKECPFASSCSKHITKDEVKSKWQKKSKAALVTAEDNRKAQEELAAIIAGAVKPTEVFTF